MVAGHFLPLSLPRVKRKGNPGESEYHRGRTTKRDVPDKSGNYKNMEPGQVPVFAQLYLYLADEFFHFTTIIAVIKHDFTGNISLEIEAYQGFIKRDHTYLPVCTDNIG